MKHGQGLFERLFEALGRLSTRELYLVGLMVVTFSFMGGWTLLNILGGGTEELQTEIESYQRAISLISEQQADLAHRLEVAEEFQERLSSGEELQLHGFLERECVASSVDRPASYADNVTPINAPGTRDATMEQI